MSPASEPPLYVDLDGTLIHGDTLRISIALLVRRAPWLLLALPFALLAGRAALKGFVASRVIPDPETLRWRPDVLAFLHGERARGRRLILATAAHRRIADAVASHLAIFDAVMATDGTWNMKSEAKLASIRKTMGGKEFDYMGDSAADLPVLRAARRSYLVDPSPRLLDEAQRGVRLERVFSTD